jgi:hypothetical protein
VGTTSLVSRVGRAVVRPFVPSSPSLCVCADTRGGGTKGRSLTVAPFGGTATPAAPADLVGAALVNEVA